MALYSTTDGKTLLFGASDPDGDPITIGKINGANVNWSANGGVAVVALTHGTARVTAAGVVTYDDGGSNSGHPTAGTTGQVNGSFTFTLMDDQGAESPVYTATVLLNGQGTQVLTGGVNDAGWDPNRDAGTTGDWFVSTSGSDSAAGSVGAPFRTVSKAVSVAGPGDVIKVRAGTYREKVDMTGHDGTSGNRIEISGYGTEKPAITGAEVLTGLTRCTTADSAVIGSALSSGTSPVFKASIAKSSLGWGDTGGLSAAAGCNLCEAGVPIHLALDRADMTANLRFFQNEPSRFHSADAMRNNGAAVSSNGSPFNQIEDASVVSKYTTAQLQNAFVRIHAQPNIVTHKTIASVSGNTITLNSSLGLQDNSTRWWALANILPNLTPGSWGYTDNGTTITFYVYPTSAANIASGIEYSVRNHPIYANSSYLKLSDMKLVQGGGLLNTDTYSIGMNTSGAAVQRFDHHYENLYIGLTDGCNNTDRPGGIQANKVDGHYMSHITFEHIANGFGVNFGNINNQRSYYVHAHRVGLAPLRHQNVTNQIIGYALYDFCGRGSHSNLGNWYSGCNDNWAHGIKARDCVGYWTQQVSGRTWMTACQIQANVAAGDNRAFNQDGDSVGANGTNGQISYRMQNWILPDPAEPVAGAAVSLGKGANIRWEVSNNVLNGGGIQNANSFGNMDHNIFTDLEWNQLAGDVFNPSNGAHAGNSVLVANQTDAAGQAVLYTNVAAGDFTPVHTDFFAKTGKSLTTGTGNIRSSLLTAFSAAEVDALLPYDLIGVAWTDPTAPSCHCYNDAANYAP